MITLTCEVVCDTCKTVIASGTPEESDKEGGWAWRTVEHVMKKARSHGAQINVVSVTCAECLAKQTEVGHDTFCIDGKYQVYQKEFPR